MKERRVEKERIRRRKGKEKVREEFKILEEGRQECLECEKEGEEG